MSNELSSGRRRELRAQAHPLHPVVLIGDNGLTDAVLREIDVHLKSHELIKIRVQGEREDREAMLSLICEQLSAQPVQHIGKTLVVYREKPPEPVKPPPRRYAGEGRSVSKRPAARTPAGRTPSGRAPAARPGTGRGAAKRPSTNAPAAPGTSRRGADRARARVSGERGPAAAPARRRARTR